MSLRNKVFVSLVFSLGFITIGIMTWRIYGLITQKEGDFVHQMPTLALTTTLELWICIIIACIPTIGPVFKTYIKPMVSRITGSSRSAGRPPSNPRDILTFGRGGASNRKRGLYSTMTVSGSQELISEEQNFSHNTSDTRMTTRVTSDPKHRDIELGDLETNEFQQPNGIHVHREFQTLHIPARGGAAPSLGHMGRPY